MQATLSTDLLMRLCRATPEQLAAVERVLAHGSFQTGNIAEGQVAHGSFQTGTGAGSSTSRSYQEPAEAALPEAVARIERKIDGIQNKVAELQTPNVPEEVQISESEAARVFTLMKKLESAPKQRKAPLLTVFRLVVLEGLSQRAAASRCGCAESLVSARTATIEQRFGRRIELLRNYASALSEMERAVKGDRRRHSAAAPDIAE